MISSLSDFDAFGFLENNFEIFFKNKFEIDLETHNLFPKMFGCQTFVVFQKERRFD